MASLKKNIMKFHVSMPAYTKPILNVGFCIVPLFQQHPQSTDPQRSHRKASTLRRLTTKPVKHSVVVRHSKHEGGHNENSWDKKKVLTITFTIFNSLMLTYVLRFVNKMCDYCVFV